MIVDLAIGSRANWGSIRSAAVAMRRLGADVRPVLFASALSQRYGDLPTSLARDGFEAWTPLSGMVEPVAMAEVAGMAATAWGQHLRRSRPDAVVVVGDRHEVLGAAMAAAYANVRLVHTMGGETSGSIDDKVRDAITALADDHCVATVAASNRVHGLRGFPEEYLETSRRIHVTGCPRIDTVRAALTSSDRGDRRAILVSQHPVTTYAAGMNHREMRDTLEAVQVVAREYHLSVELFWPNADAGTDETHQAIREWLATPKAEEIGVRTHRAMGPEEYSQMMAGCTVMAGNSSSALREGAWIGTPAVNVGMRQRCREHDANVVDVEGGAQPIAAGLRFMVGHGPWARSTRYGDGFSGEKVASVVVGGQT